MIFFSLFTQCVSFPAVQCTEAITGYPDRCWCSKR
jgi:hypothetical protein